MINGDQVRRQPAAGRVAYLILQQLAGAGILTNEGDRRVVLGKPGIVVGINRDAIGHAVGGGSSNLREGMRGWIEATNFEGSCSVCVQLEEEGLYTSILPGGVLVLH